MKQLRYCLPVALAAALLVTPARSCGPDFPEAIFVLPNGPGGSYALFAAGRLGVPQAGYRTRNLVIAYDYLTHRPLSPSEQQQAADVDHHFIDRWSYEDTAKKTDPPTGFALWIAARTALGPVDKYTPDDKLETALNINYGEVPNCLDDAFATATRTLTARSAAYGTRDPAVIEWVRGQDAVFSNCGDGKPRQYFGPGQPPPPPPAPHPPAALPTNAPLWLQQDRGYQLAAASFYATHYDDAITEFHAIAADTVSPWSPIARYLVARALIRKASTQDTHLTNPDGDAAKQAAAKSSLNTTLALAQHELLAMQSDPRMAPLHHAVDGLLDYVNLRLQPDAQAAVLADRLHGPATDRFGQSLIDLTYLRTNPTEPSDPPAPNTPDPGSNDMLAWIKDISIPDQTADILHHWRTTHSTAWLLVAIMSAKPTDAVTPELIHAAQAIPKDDPGYVAITYHRLRLSPNDPATRLNLLALLPDLEKHETISTINLFTVLNAKSAPTLESWLSTAGRLPAGESSYDEVEDFDPSTALNAATTDDAQRDATPPTAEDVCGTKIKPHATRLFDLDAADALNRDMPLSLLATAAESHTLPANLQFQVAQATWARAVLLDQPAIARRMTPLLIRCRAAWKPVLAAYDASTTAGDRHANGLLALMRFASTEPSVRYGEERRNGFAAYDVFRQNWWCSTVPAPGDTIDTYFKLRDESRLDDYAGIPDPGNAIAPPAPVFLTPTDLAKAASEIAALNKIPNASTYFAKAALAWMKLHPKDPRTPDILGEADRVVRNACRIDPPYDAHGKQTADPHNMTFTTNLAHALFDALHENYPQSPWTRRYKSWQ
jgi:hypothetical protein